MLSYRLGTVNDFHLEFKPVLNYSKLHTFSTFFGKEKKKNRHITCSATDIMRLYAIVCVSGVASFITNQ